MNSKIRNMLLCFALVLSCLLSCFVTIPINNVYASNIDLDYTIKYTNVLEDLQKNKDFNIENYPEIATDYSLQVLDIAESNDKELFVYVYQPSGSEKNLVATTINIATTFGNDLKFYNYKLTLLNNNDVFYKYKVENFVVSSASVREYEITSIYRTFDETIDNELNDDNDNTINEVNYKVAKHWKFGLETSCQDIETITITDKYVGFVRYYGGYSLFSGTDCDSHFVAFSTDKEIDKLMEADVYFQYQNVDKTTMYAIPSIDYGDIKNEYVYIDYTQSTSFTGGGWWSSTYTWERIQTPNEFFASVENNEVFNCGIFDVETSSVISEENKALISDKDWVLRFVETKYLEEGTATSKHYNWDIVSNVSIMRLKFETNGIVYNLGVIDNKQSGSLNSFNENNFDLELSDMFKIILGVLLLIVLVILLSPILPFIFSFIGWLLKIIIKIVIWIISLPFKLIKFIIKGGAKSG